MPREMTIVPPIGGIARSSSYQNQHPYTCYDAVNVRGLDVHKERERIGSRPGMVKEFSQDLGGVIRMLGSVRYLDTVTGEWKTKQLAICDGYLWSDDGTGTMAQITSTRFGTGDTIHGVEYKQKFYIADHGQRLEGTTGIIAVALDGDFQDAAHGDFAALGIVAGDKLEIISGTDANPGTYNIDTVATTTLTIAGTPVSDDGANADLVYIIWRASVNPKVYDPSDNTVGNWTASTAGTIPKGCPCIAVYHDRVVLGGNEPSPHQYYMSRAGDAHDWDYSLTDGTDKTRACSASNTQSGEIGQPIKAIIDHGDKCCLFFGLTKTFVMRGDPCYGGVVEPISDGVGAVCQGAVAAAPGIAPNTPPVHYFLSRDGLYVVPAGCGQKPISISREKLPQELRNLDTTLETGIKVNLMYSPETRGLHIFLSAKTASAATTHWYFDRSTGAFWAEKYNDTDLQPYSVDKTAAASGRDDVIFGCNDGYIRKFSYASETDIDAGDAEIDIVSYVDIGPLKIGSGFLNGAINEMTAVLSANTTTVTVEVTTADTPEGATAHTGTARKYSGTFRKAGYNPSMYKVGYGRAAMIKVAGVVANANEAWGLEGIILSIKPAGKTRIP